MLLLSLGRPLRWRLLWSFGADPAPVLLTAQWRELLQQLQQVAEEKVVEEETQEHD